MAARLQYRFWLAWRRDRRRHSSGAWDEQYKAGQWDYLSSLAELDHYSVIVGYIRHFFEQADILDVGCGDGRLPSLLHPSYFKRYTGVDHSQEAIGRANRLRIANALFIREDFEKWIPRDLADVMVFNESLYYGRDPSALVKRYVPTLRTGGKIIVSMHSAGKHHIIWRMLDSALHCIHGVRVDIDRRQTWIVRIFEPNPNSDVAL